MSTAAIIQDTDTIDAFAAEAVTVKVASLKECMVLMDPELGTPLMWLDHKMRTVRNSGTSTWMAHNLDSGRIEEVSLRANGTIAVLAA